MGELRVLVKYFKNYMIDCTKRRSRLKHYLWAYCGMATVDLIGHFAPCRSLNFIKCEKSLNSTHHSLLDLVINGDSTCTGCTANEEKENVKYTIKTFFPPFKHLKFCTTAK